MVGSKLAHYTILERLGAGGMGEVYLAEDGKLHRKVALKVLPAAMSDQPERLSRFRREAEAVAALSHPNIVTIYSVEEERGQHFLTMELIEGETLAAAIAPGGLSLARILDLAVPIADALAAAHEAGVVHRDLKPSNIMIDRRGQVRLMDFGLAKLAGRDEVEASDLPTEALTREGVQLGTVPYMAPEQVKGRAVDQRADLFALGIILYEMAAGRRPFEGESAPEMMSAILRDVPPSLAERRHDLPRQFDRIVSHCLQKDPEKRFQTALDLRNELESLAEEVASGSGVGQPESARRRARMPLWSAGALLLLAVAAALWWVLEGGGGPAGVPGQVSSDAPVTRRVSQLTFGDEVEEWPAVSPDGAWIVYSAETEGFKKLYRRHLESGDVEQLTEGFADDIQAAFAPDGRSLAFVRAAEPSGKVGLDDLFGSFYGGAGDIWKLDLGSGEEELLIEEAFGPAWSPDGETLAFEAEWVGAASRIWVADARGRNPRQVTIDSSEAVGHHEPSFAPGGDRIVFRRREKSKSDILVVALAGGEPIWVTDDGYRDLDPRWTPEGAAIVFSSFRGGGQNLWRQPVDVEGRPVGRAIQLTTGAGNDVQPALAPDGERLGFAILGINSDLWRLPLDPETGMAVGEPEELVSTTREDSRGAWSPDGRWLAFNSDRHGDMNLWLLSLEEGTERQLTRGPGGDFQPNWSPDGRRIAFFSSRGGNVDIWSVEVASGELTRLTDHPSVDEDPFFSPDGRFVAFQSDRDGRMELWVMRSDGSEQRQVSSLGSYGHFVRWVDETTVLNRIPGDHEIRYYLHDVEGGRTRPIPGMGEVGGHMSLSPDGSLLLDAQGHRTLWVYPIAGGERRKVFEFEAPEIRIDYPVWSPDGRWVVFDRAVYSGADIWLLEGL